MRLNVFLQKAGIGSRREAERLIADGRVSVNGLKAEVTTPAELGDDVRVDGKPVAPNDAPLPRLFALNKPVDFLCTNFDPQGRSTIFDLRVLQDKSLPRLMNVGRLDVNSEGLLLMSSDGPLAQKLMHPDTGLARIYRVRVRGRLSPEHRHALAQGVEIDGIYYRGARFEEDRVEEGKANAWYKVELFEGKNREIRRLMEHFGCVVNRLIRVAYGPFHLGTLQTGEMREIPEAQVKMLLKDLEEKYGAASHAN